MFLSVFDQCRVVAFAAATGKRAWAFQTRGWVYGAAVATPAHVFVGSQDKHFYCVDKKTGKQVWKFVTKGRVESGGAVDDRYVYFGSCDGGLYCLGQADGKERWRFDTDRTRTEAECDLLGAGPAPGRRSTSPPGEGQFYAVAADTGQAAVEAAGRRAVRPVLLPGDRRAVASS